MYKVRVVSGYNSPGYSNNISSVLSKELEWLQEAGATIVNIRYVPYSDNNMKVNAFIHYLEDDNIPF